MQRKSLKNNANRQLFSQRFRNLREKLHLSQREISKMLGFSTNTQVSKFENAESEPMLETLRKLAQLSRRTDIRIDLHELITGKPSHVVEDWKEENQKLLELLAKYISSETSRLIDERHNLWGTLSEAEQKAAKHIAGQDEFVQHLKAQIKQVEGLLADAAEDQHYVQEALEGIIRH